MPERNQEDVKRLFKAFGVLAAEDVDEAADETVSESASATDPASVSGEEPKHTQRPTETEAWESSFAVEEIDSRSKPQRPSMAQSTPPATQKVPDGRQAACRRKREQKAELKEAEHIQTSIISS